MDFYHVLNRGIEKRNIVLDDGDRQRFVRGLFVFNDSKNAPNGITQKKLWEDFQRRREPLVYIHAWCLMDNHYHLLVSPIEDEQSNLSLFMKKLNMGYAKFFNEKYSRTGYLWQGKYKKVRIERDSHFNYIPYYIHLNALDYKFYEKWRSGTLASTNEAFTALSKYRWSSYSDYFGKKNFPSLIHNSVVREILGSPQEQQKTIREIISSSGINMVSKEDMLES